MAQGKAYSRAADVWALGCILFEVCWPHSVMSSSIRAVTDDQTRFYCTRAADDVTKCALAHADQGKGSQGPERPGAIETHLMRHTADRWLEDFLL